MNNAFKIKFITLDKVKHSMNKNKFTTPDQADSFN